MMRLDSCSSAPSSSESDLHGDSLGDLSDSSVDRERSFLSRLPRRHRRQSATSVSTNPGEDAYVMVLQNRQGLCDDLRSIVTSRDVCDVTFLVGEERKPVHGVRAVIATRSKLLYDLIVSHEKNRNKDSKRHCSRVKRTLYKLNCASSRRHLMKTSSTRLTIPMTSFDPESFQKLLNYIHSGTLSVDARTVIGLLNAAYMFGFPELRQACWDFALGCTARADNLSDLLASAKMYHNHKMTILLLKTIKNFTEVFPEIKNQIDVVDNILQNNAETEVIQGILELK
ncbi:serine-enriched protein-like [Mya arenaria]|uniref:serine-enriched protein-like n=1 Tax=Mya arenaria TaxID=6604 RepID=UPI0022E781D7|nr:serine-enriched protein-like [Mya arenaria]